MEQRAMTKHTPGPWTFEVGENGDDFNLNGPEYRIIGGCECCGSPWMSGKRYMADARLIAAAPDLLEALQGVLRVADRKTTEFDAARAAIAKSIGVSEHSLPVTGAKT
jgi:hypothetical protein